MSINRGVAALGAVGVVAVATLAITIPIAAAQGKPVPRAQITSGSKWVHSEPLKQCYNGGKELDKTQQNACVTALQKQVSDRKAPQVPVHFDGKVLFNLDKAAANKSWSAYVTGGAGLVGYENGSLVTNKNQGAGPIGAQQTFTAQQNQQGGTSIPSSVVVWVISGDAQHIYGVWQFQLNQITAGS